MRLWSFRHLWHLYVLWADYEADEKGVYIFSHLILCVAVHSSSGLTAAQNQLDPLINYITDTDDLITVGIIRQVMNIKFFMLI